MAYTPPAFSASVNVEYDAPTYDNVNIAPAGQDVPDISVFFDQLAPYGQWYDDANYGWVFTPNDPNYVPYTNGHWMDTDYGMLWVSAEPFGWATAHYGRWVFQNRWMWVPDTQWGPAWVSWREGNGWVGWAPEGFAENAYIPDQDWRFVAAPSLFAPNLDRFYIRGNLAGYIQSSAPIIRYHRYGNEQWVAGPSEDWLQRYHVAHHRERANLNQLGRFDAQQRAQAERQVQQHRGQWQGREIREQQVHSQLQQQEQRHQQAQRQQAQQERAYQQPGQRMIQQQPRGNQTERFHAEQPQTQQNQQRQQEAHGQGAQRAQQQQLEQQRQHQQATEQQRAQGQQRAQEQQRVQQEQQQRGQQEQQQRAQKQQEQQHAQAEQHAQQEQQRAQEEQERQRGQQEQRAQQEQQHAQQQEQQHAQQEQHAQQQAQHQQEQQAQRQPHEQQHQGQQGDHHKKPGESQ